MDKFYIIHVTKEKGVKIDSRLNILIWQVVFLMAFALIYSPHDLTVKDNVVFFTFKNLAWGLCLSCVIFSCSRGTGGLVNDFLSLELLPSNIKNFFHDLLPAHVLQLVLLLHAGLYSELQHVVDD